MSKYIGGQCSFFFKGKLTYVLKITLFVDLDNGFIIKTSHYK